MRCRRLKQIPRLKPHFDDGRATPTLPRSARLMETMKLCVSRHAVDQARKLLRVCHRRHGRRPQMVAERSRPRLLRLRWQFRRP
eukprot:1398283-Pleurochrysis_carterae.AAC.1